MDHGATNETIDATVDPAALRPDQLDTMRREVDDVLAVPRRQWCPTSPAASRTCSIRSRAAAGWHARSMPVIAVPLVLLALFVIFLVVGYGTEARRPELAALRLRGTRWWLRWWVAAGETLLPIVAGAALVVPARSAGRRRHRRGALRPRHTVGLFDLYFHLVRAERRYRGRPRDNAGPAAHAHHAGRRPAAHRPGRRSPAGGSWPARSSSSCSPPSSWPSCGSSTGRWPGSGSSRRRSSCWRSGC